MKERPILMSAPMVRAIRAGQKTQTRRTVTRLLDRGPVTEFGRSDTPGYAWTFRNRRRLWHDIREDALLPLCPYGQPGDRLWVREAWWHMGRWEGKEWLGYDPDRAFLPVDSCRRFADPGEQRKDAYHWRKRPSIHMPRWASRITLELTGVRVERLQDIGNEDALAEGICPWTKDGQLLKYWAGDPSDASFPCAWADLPRDPVTAYRLLWEHINGPGSWDLNPYVWAVTFLPLENPCTSP